MGTERPKATAYAQRFHWSSLTGPNPATHARLVWQYSSSENQLHWQPDVTFGEDQCRPLPATAVLNATILREMTLYSLSQTPEKTVKNAHLNARPTINDFLVSSLKLAWFWSPSPVGVVSKLGYMVAAMVKPVFGILLGYPRGGGENSVSEQVASACFRPCATTF